MSWERVWMFVSIVLLATAGICLWRNNLSPAFVTAALGACAWFLSYRSHLRSKLPDDSESSNDQTPEEPNED